MLTVWTLDSKSSTFRICCINNYFAFGPLLRKNSLYIFFLSQLSGTILYLSLFYFKVKIWCYFVPISLVSSNIIPYIKYSTVYNDKFLLLNFLIWLIVWFTIDYKKFPNLIFSYIDFRDLQDFVMRQRMFFEIFFEKNPSSELTHHVRFIRYLNLCTLKMTILAIF